MALAERAACFSPFLAEADFNNSNGYINGRLCSTMTGTSCCLPCPLTEWVYPDNFNAISKAAEWIAVCSTICCLFLLASWIVLPVDKTHRHYLSICLTTAVMVLGLGFVVPLAGQPEECADRITPNGMASNSVCGASGALLIFGGWSAVVWVFLRSMSLHLQICWQVVVGRTFMWVAQTIGWGIPILGTVLALVLSGVSFRLGPTCHINHVHSLAVLWIPLLVFSGITIVVQFFTFGYCIKVYLASLADTAASTEGSGLPSYSNSIRTMTPRQAYRRVRRVIQLQWRGIAIVLIIIADVIFFSIVFVFQDNTVQHLRDHPQSAQDWLVCLATTGDKNKCLDLADGFSVKEATVAAVLILLSMNGFWLLVLLGRWSMALGWVDLVTPEAYRTQQREFVSVDARLDDLKKDTRSYEMLSRDASSVGHSPTKNGVVTALAIPTTVATTAAPAAAAAPPPGRLNMADASPPVSPGSPGSPAGSMRSPTPLVSLGALASMGADDGARRRGDDDRSGTPSGRRTPDYFGQTARYNAPSRSFSSPRPPATSVSSASSIRWDAQESFAAPAPVRTARSPPARSARSPPPRTYQMRSPSQDNNSNSMGGGFDSRNPLGMNRI